MADFIASTVACMITLIVCALALYASLISFSLFGYAFKWFDAFCIVLMAAGIIVSFASMIFVCHEFFSK
ncbi:hypothetical protein LCA12A_0898 [Lacticaseibacillus casei 12A]|uniref:hypothetical protein n=1 Tax=Lacticaseibacillus paracasei TaxID=1597 RepID=UPI0002978542|nr:hypothetical protein [Lacticaseibacillus paracasei]EKP98119.1 hypothetical protein LCA12A_0898 [Lacticaseibacillus casei 12A]